MSTIGQGISIVPYDMEIECCMSNFDHTIESWAEDRLCQEEVYAQYSGWEFCGYVWYDRDSELFKCEVWRYNVPVQIYEADNLLGIMSDVSSDWGYE